MSIEVRQLEVRAGRTLLVDGVSAHWPAGAVHAILGPNGAGKSSLLAAITGERRVAAGEVLWWGKGLGTYRTPELALRRAVVLQDNSVGFNFSAREVVELGRYPHRLRPSQREAEIVDEALDALHVLHLRQRLYASLSGGERARVQLARALAQIWEPQGASARWLLLDEPTAALDIAHQHAALGLVRRWAQSQGVGVLLVLHDLNLALRYADTALVLNRGRIEASGAVAQALQPALIERVWGVACECLRSTHGMLHMVLHASNEAGDQRPPKIQD